jgi:hypothetical protein
MSECGFHAEPCFTRRSGGGRAFFEFFRQNFLWQRRREMTELSRAIQPGFMMVLFHGRVGDLKLDEYRWQSIVT